MTRSRASRLSAGPFSRGDADHSKMVRVQAAALGPRRYGAAARASIVCCAAACAAASAAEPNASDPYDRSALYEELYSKLGYHANPTLSHGKELIALRVVPWFGNLSSRGLSARVLDVGCSHGLGVALLWSHGLYASGLDLSPTAVRMATTLRVPPEQAVANPWWPCGRDACFKVGSAAALPWANASFDAILTTDVLEHVPPPLVPSVAAEFSRVVQRGFGGGALFMAIALKEDMCCTSRSGEPRGGSASSRRPARGSARSTKRSARPLDHAVASALCGSSASEGPCVGSARADRSADRSADRYIHTVLGYFSENTVINCYSIHTVLGNSVINCLLSMECLDSIRDIPYFTAYFTHVTPSCSISLPKRKPAGES